MVGYYRLPSGLLLASNHQPVSMTQAKFEECCCKVKQCYYCADGTPDTLLVEFRFYPCSVTLSRSTNGGHPYYSCYGGEEPSDPCLWIADSIVACRTTFDVLHYFWITARLGPQGWTVSYINYADHTGSACDPDCPQVGGSCWGPNYGGEDAMWTSCTEPFDTESFHVTPQFGPPARMLASAEPARPGVQGVGDRVHDTLKILLGQEAIAGCGCGSVIAEMNALGIDGCKRELERLTDKLVDTATKKNWVLEPEAGIEVPAEDIGKPVPQTRRTRLARLLARFLCNLPAGESFVRSQCRGIILLAIERAEKERDDATSRPDS